jgi:hypothetical protein
MFRMQILKRRMSKKGRLLRVHFKSGAMIDLVPPGSLASGLRVKRGTKEATFMRPDVGKLWRQFGGGLIARGTGDLLPAGRPRQPAHPSIGNFARPVKWTPITGEFVALARICIKRQLICAASGVRVSYRTLSS